MIVYVNGKFLPKEHAKISVFDHGFLYGDGVFEGIRAYNGKIFKLDEHIDRLLDSAKAIDLKIKHSHQELCDLCYESLKQNKLEDAYLRVILSRGEGDLSLNPYLCEEAGVVIISGKIKLYPKELYDEGMAVITGATPRVSPEALNPKIKSLNYLNNIMAKMEGLQHNVQETLMLNSHGYLAEATGDNIFVVKNSMVITPPEEAGILLGITREVVMELVKESNYEMVEKNISRYDVYTADECFLTGTAAEIISVTKVDGRIIGNGEPGSITLELLEKFRALTLGK